MKKLIIFIASLITGYFAFDLFIQNPAGIFGEHIVVHIAKLEFVREFFRIMGYIRAFFLHADILFFYFLL